jgi:hypothetical protein
MNWIKLTALPVLVLSLLFSMASCEKDSEDRKRLEFSKTGIVMSFAQETPATPQVPSNALGLLDVHYRKDTRILNYKITWSGLSSAPTLIHIHGLAPIGYPAGIVQTILAASNPTLFPSTGSYTGTMLVDGVVIKEQDLLNGFYYMNIHTTANPNGEIRGQIRFQ